MVKSSYYEFNQFKVCKSLCEYVKTSTDCTGTFTSAFSSDETEIFVRTDKISRPQFFKHILAIDRLTADSIILFTETIRIQKFEVSRVALTAVFTTTMKDTVMSYELL